MQSLDWKMLDHCYTPSLGVSGHPPLLAPKLLQCRLIRVLGKVQGQNGRVPPFCPIGLDTVALEMWSLVTSIGLSMNGLKGVIGRHHTCTSLSVCGDVTDPYTEFDCGSMLPFRAECI